jgi:hypothetical protein
MREREFIELSLLSPRCTLHANLLFLHVYTFLTYSNFDHAALVIVNSEDRVDAPASGYGVEPHVTLRHLKVVSGLPIFSVSNTSWAKFAFAAASASASAPALAVVETDEIRDESNDRVHNASPSPKLFPFPVQFIPLKCGGRVAQQNIAKKNDGAAGSLGTAQGNCIAVEEAEQLVHQEVSWGVLDVSLPINSDETEKKHSYTFLTSNFGSILLNDSVVALQMASPVHGCDENDVTVNDVDIETNGFALIMDRGKCSFQQKMEVAEKAGARLAIIIDTKDEPLQRVGGQLPSAGYVGIPSVLVTKVCGDFLRKELETSSGSGSGNDARVRAKLLLANDDTASAAWIDLAFYAWKDSSSERLLQLKALFDKYKSEKDSKSYVVEIAAWLQRKIQEIEGDVSSSSEL